MPTLNKSLVLALNETLIYSNGFSTTKASWVFNKKEHLSLIYNDKANIRRNLDYLHSFSMILKILICFVWMSSLNKCSFDGVSSPDLSFRTDY